MSELKLRDDILDELEYEPIVDAAHIGVTVDRDVVTLTGHVGSYAQKLAAISAVRRVKGVHGIADEITFIMLQMQRRLTMRSPAARLMCCPGTVSFLAMRSRSRCGTGW
jgi:hypothetical protein